MSFEEKLAKGKHDKQIKEEIETQQRQAEQKAVEAELISIEDKEKQRKLTLIDELAARVDINYINRLLQSVIDALRPDIEHPADLKVETEYLTNTDQIGIKIGFSWVNSYESDSGPNSDYSVNFTAHVEYSIFVYIIKQGKLPPKSYGGYSGRHDYNSPDPSTLPIVSVDEYLIFLEDKLSRYRGKSKGLINRMTSNYRSEYYWDNKVSTTNPDWQQKLEEALIDVVTTRNLL